MYFTHIDGRSVKSLSSSSRKPARIVAVAQAKLTFIKPSQTGMILQLPSYHFFCCILNGITCLYCTILTAIPRHPLPFAAKNMFYDERWIEKQERGFTWWMNYVLTPDDFKVATEVPKGRCFCFPSCKILNLLL